MINYIKSGIPLILLLCGLSISTYGQVITASFDQYISDKKNISHAEVKMQSEVKEFYTRVNYQVIWLQKENALNLQLLLNQVKQAAGYGLEEKDYQFNYLESFRKGTVNLTNSVDSFEAELRFTDAAIHLYNDIAFGNSKPAFGFNGLKYSPGCYNIPALLSSTIFNNSFDGLISTITPSIPEYAELKNKNSHYVRVMEESNFNEVVISSRKVNATNKALIKKLYQLGFLEEENQALTDSMVKTKVKEAQRQFGLLSDGVLRSTILEALNCSLRIRRQQLKLALNYYSWLNCLVINEPVIVVNIPAAYLKVYDKKGVTLEMKMVVGKNSTPTPTLSSRVSEVVLYPYWHVPNSIATRELLPLIKRDRGYINTGNYQVLDKSGNIVDPYSINWHALSRNYFPYLIRQSTGCDNALGLLKLNFYSPFGVYLHDTPFKNAFGLNKRYFSHGCMRMEKPMEMGHMVLKNNAIAIDTLEQKGCLRNQSPVVVKADINMPVIVWYNPAGIDSAGHLLFYEDVYEKFRWMK